MTDRPRAGRAAPPSVPARQDRRRWLLFVHQLPSTPSNLRVRTWRRLQQIGAVPIKQAVYVLPDTAATREDFEWLKTEVKASGGDASVFAADNVDAWSDDALIEAFRQSGREAYAALTADVEKVLKRTGRARQPRGARAPAIRRLLEKFRGRLAAIEGVDFFGSAGRERVVALLGQLEERTPQAGRPLTSTRAAGPRDPAAYLGRLWVTRARPGVDRMASAWLIRRFIDPQARFGFAPDREAVPGDAIAFDMFGVELSHQGEGCTFETLCAAFGVDEPAVARIATIVHELDLKDGTFGAPETATVGTLIDGLQFTYGDDEALLAQGIVLFEAMYRSFERLGRPAGRAGGTRPAERSRAGRRGPGRAARPRR